MRWRTRWSRPLLAGALCAAVSGGIIAVHAPDSIRATDAAASFASASISFAADDGAVLHASIGWFGPLEPRPLIVGDSPYAPDVSTLDWSGGSFNYVELQWRGTGLSGGTLDSTGLRDQKDLSEFLGWACTQSWSNGNIGLYGFSASAIVVYNAMHLALPCVRAAALMSGTVDLYRDLLYIGGVPSPVVGAAVEGLIVEPWMSNALARAQSEPATVPASLDGFAAAPVQVGANMTEDPFWNERSFQGDPNHIPVLADDGFYDVEERGAFGGYEATKTDGSHLLVMGAHDGWEPGTPGPFPHYTAWFDHWLLDQPDSDPAVSVELSNGSREQFLAGNVTSLSGSAWPLPGTTWTDLYLSKAGSGTVRSINDGSLAMSPDATTTRQPYPFVPSIADETDVHSIAAVAGDGIDQSANYLPFETDLQLAGPSALTYTTPVLEQPVDAVGPVGLDLYASSTQPVTDLVAVVADVWPDGSAYPVATGWLRTSYPAVDTSRSFVDPAGEIVDPYTDFSVQTLTLPGKMREYHIEVLPIGNHFATGHRIRLYILGTPLDMQSSPSGVNVVSTGGVTLSRLIFPTFGTSLATALGR
ncbi:MAG: CocE/NonD family hydrolase [Acidimicrobiales bacterium]